MSGASPPGGSAIGSGPGMDPDRGPDDDGHVTLGRRALGRVELEMNGPDARLGIHRRDHPDYRLDLLDLGRRRSRSPDRRVGNQSRAIHFGLEMEQVGTGIGRVEGERRSSQLPWSRTPGTVIPFSATGAADRDRGRPTILMGISVTSRTDNGRLLSRERSRP